MKKKIALLGDSAVGKTSLIRRYVFDVFESSYISTVGCKITKKNLLIQRPDQTHNLTFVIWDLIGREGYSAVQTRTFVGVDGAILVADLTRKETLKSLERYWIPLLFKVVEEVPMIFVCNKSDLKEDFEFQPEELEDMAKRYNSAADTILRGTLKTNYSTSAKEAINVEEAFEALGHLVLAEGKYEDPVKKVYEILTATGIRRNSDRTTPIGALDVIIVDFCEGFSDSRMAMVILRQEIARAGLDINKPTKEGILKAVEYFAEAENEFMDEKTVFSNLERRRELANDIK
ncbi:MAG: GTP-binding protein [Thermoplasmata archaeon]|nr:MAG: GTP-binding protein [Thermoplasmata archaeon]